MGVQDLPRAVPAGGLYTGEMDSRPFVKLCRVGFGMHLSLTRQRHSLILSHTFVKSMQTEGKSFQVIL